MLAGYPEKEKRKVDLENHKNLRTVMLKSDLPILINNVQQTLCLDNFFGTVSVILNKEIS